MYAELSIIITVLQFDRGYVNSVANKSSIIESILTNSWTFFVAFISYLQEIAIESKDWIVFAHF